MWYGNKTEDDDTEEQPPRPRSLTHSDNDEDTVTVYDRRMKKENHSSSYPSRINPFELEQPEEPENNILVDEPETRCGLGSWSPDWLQVFANKKAFLVVFTILGVIQGMGWAYFTAIITTLEKRFQISTQTTGIVMTGNEISQILFSIFIAYYGSRGHRPRWIAMGVFLSALSCFVLASPHFIFGSGKNALFLTKEYSNPYFDSPSQVIVTNNDTDSEFVTSENNNVSLSMSSLSSTMSTSFPVSTFFNDENTSSHVCTPEAEWNKENDQCGEAGTSSLVPLILIFISQFVAGVGVLLFFSLGGPYLDDNIKSQQLPLMFGITMSLRLIGPVLGFLFASACLNVYISPGLTPIITPKDARWLGAWWLGWVLLGVITLMFSFLIALFPKEMPKTALRKHAIETETGNSMLSRAGSALYLSTAELTDANPVPTFSDIPKAVNILLQNRINLFNTMAGVFYIFAGIGYWTYIPKYLETMFRQTAAEASVIAGTVSIASQAGGMLLSGVLMSKFLPDAKILAIWNSILAFAHVIISIIFTQLGCDPGNFILGTYDTSLGGYNLTSSCNMDCNCNADNISPVCDMGTQTMFYSACHAGCNLNDNETSVQTFSDCFCASNSTLISGPCSNSGCYGSFVAFLVLTAFIQFLQGTGRISNMLISYRCVHPTDKSLAIGLSLFLVSILALLPSPIVYGTIIDSVCLVWGSTCSQSKGNCWLYNSKSLRYAFNLTAAGFLLVGGVFDVLVWRNVKDLALYDDHKNTTISSVQQRLERQRNSPKPRARSGFWAYS